MCCIDISPLNNNQARSKEIQPRCLKKKNSKVDIVQKYASSLLLCQEGDAAFHVLRSQQQAASRRQAAAGVNSRPGSV